MHKDVGVWGRNPGVLGARGGAAKTTGQETNPVDSKELLGNQEAGPADTTGPGSGSFQWGSRRTGGHSSSGLRQVRDGWAGAASAHGRLPCALAASGLSRATHHTCYLRC